ncbi:hypothetical protein VPH35_104751 [Triticum aestivum]
MCAWCYLDSSRPPTWTVNYRLSDLPSTTTYGYRTSTTTAPSSTTVDPRRPRGRLVPCRDPEHLRTRTTSVAEDPCTTTVALYDYLHDERPENRLICTLRRYNRETIVRERLHVLYEMHPLSAPCPSCHLLGPPLLPLTRGNPVTGSTPPFVA